MIHQPFACLSKRKLLVVLVQYYLVFCLIVHDHENLLVTHEGELHCLLEETSLSLVERNIPLVHVVDKLRGVDLLFPHIKQ
jgi:hypothetical protein